MEERRKPPALPAGGTIAVVAPASPVRVRSEIEQGLAYFRRRGYTVVEAPHTRSAHGYLAGTDAERAADLRWALTEPGIDMVLALLGGYGTARLHPLVDWASLGEPRIVCGYSDLTALHLALGRQAGWVSFYGPGLLRFTAKRGVLSPETEEWFHRAFRPDPLGRVFADPDDPYVTRIGGGGTVEAPIVGGNLTLVSHSIGTPFELDADGCILMLEDVDNEPYMVDACLTHLRNAGKLEGIAGLVFGTPENLVEQTAGEPWGTLTVEEVLDELIAPLGVPAIGNVPVGHGTHLATLPLGVRARLDADAGTLEILEAAVTG